MKGGCRWLAELSCFRAALKALFPNTANLLPAHKLNLPFCLFVSFYLSRFFHRFIYLSLRIWASLFSRLGRSIAPNGFCRAPCLPTIWLWIAFLGVFSFRDKLYRILLYFYLYEFFCSLTFYHLLIETSISLYIVSLPIKYSIFWRNLTFLEHSIIF